MMQAVLYIGHGTRLAKGVTQCIEFIESVKRLVRVPIQEIAFLEIVEPSIEIGVRRCVERGATSIAIMPLLLLTAQHAKVDIPQELQIVQRQYPTIRFSYGKPLGIEMKLITEVATKINVAIEKTWNKETLRPLVQNGEADILLVFRGSSDLGLAMQADEICRFVSELTTYKNVKASFLYGAGWHFEDALKSYELSGKAVIIVPYLLFDGLLSVGIEKKINAARAVNPFILLSEKLGHGENVQQVMLKRVEQCLQMEGVFV